MTFPLPPVPIVLAPIAGIATTALAIETARAGALPLVPCAYLAPERIAHVAAEMRGATERAFGLNLFVEEPLRAPDVARLARAHERLRPFRERLGLAQPRVAARPAERYAAQIDALIAARPAVASFTFGLPSGEVLARLRAAGIATLATATTVAEARAAERAGFDAVVAQGAEAGGHRGTFLYDGDEFRADDATLVGTLALVPLVVDAVRIPVVAAGGIGDGRAVAAVLALGADAAALGSAFLLADEAATTPAHRRAIAAGDRPTALTTVFSGRPARGIVVEMMREIAADDVAPYPFQNAMTRDLRDAAAAADDERTLSLWAGQAAGLARPEPAAAIVRRILDEARTAAVRSSRRLDEPCAGARMTTDPAG